MSTDLIGLLTSFEISEYDIVQGNKLSESTYDKIMEDVLTKRAKKRCLNLLQKKNYTEYKLREKLRESCYPTEIEDKAITYVKSFHYIDDYRYACDYIFYHKDTETKKKIEEKLRLKGIEQDILHRAFSDSYDEEEEIQIELAQALKLLQKKRYDRENMDWKEKQKIQAYLLRKGIRNSVIKSAMSMQNGV